MTQEKKETYAEDEITCPNCKGLRGGGDSFEADDYGEEDCECGCKYKWIRDVSVTYSTEEI